MERITGSSPNGVLTLYHGTNQQNATSILDRGIRLEESREATDFGRGFYTTTSFEQARDLANRRARGVLAPVVLKIEVSLEAVADLAVLPFVRPTEDFWTLISYCRGGASGHGRAGKSPWFDVVVGPVTRRMAGQLSVFPDYDQWSFHTGAGIAVLRLVGPIG